MTHLILSANEPKLTLLAACLVLGALSHLFFKIAKVNKASDGNFNAARFFAIEWPYIGMSICAMIILLIAQGNVARLQIAGRVVGDWMYLAFAIFGWASDSLMYNIGGRAESIIRKEAKEADTDYPTK